MDEPLAWNLTHSVIGACMEVHRVMGPGLLESVYEECLAQELRFKGIGFERQVPVPLVYRGVSLSAQLFIDLVVENELVVELKSVDRLAGIHEAQLLTYLRLTARDVGLLVNFNVPALRLGIRRMRRKKTEVETRSVNGG